jgi:hypothetical protein
MFFKLCLLIQVVGMIAVLIAWEVFTALYPEYRQARWQWHGISQAILISHTISFCMGARAALFSQRLDRELTKSRIVKRELAATNLPVELVAPADFHGVPTQARS